MKSRTFSSLLTAYNRQYNNNGSDIYDFVINDPTRTIKSSESATNVACYACKVPLAECIEALILRYTKWQQASETLRHDIQTQGVPQWLFEHHGCPSPRSPASAKSVVEIWIDLVQHEQDLLVYQSLALSPNLHPMAACDTPIALRMWLNRTFGFALTSDDVMYIDPTLR